MSAVPYIFSKEFREHEGTENRISIGAAALTILVHYGIFI